MPNLRDKTWTPTTPAQTADAQFWEDHLIDDASYEGLQEILEGGGGGGHIIQNPSGTEMPQQPVLQFINATVTNGEGKTIVSGNGEKGDAATVAVGTVTTGAAGTNAQVTNSGTQYDAVLDFVIPRGADGIPLGGTAGQTIVKQSSADRDAIWSNINASNVNIGAGTVETLAGSIATIETSPATANHSVGEYIVYNGQLYKVTTAITAGTTLNGKISAESVMDLNVVTITNNGLDFKYAKFGRVVLVDISGVPTTTSQFTTSGFPTAIVGNHMTTPQWGAIANQVQIWIDDNASVINMRYQQATNLRATLIYVS